MHTLLHMHPTEGAIQARTMAAAPLSRVVAASAIDASKVMASLLRLSGVMPNSRSGDANDRRVSAFYRLVFVGRKSVEGFARTLGCWQWLNRRLACASMLNAPVERFIWLRCKRATLAVRPTG